MRGRAGGERQGTHPASPRRGRERQADQPRPAGISRLRHSQAGGGGRPSASGPPGVRRDKVRCRARRIGAAAAAAAAPRAARREAASVREPVAGETRGPGRALGTEGPHRPDSNTGGDASEWLEEGLDEIAAMRKVRSQPERGSPLSRTALEMRV